MQSISGNGKIPCEAPKSSSDQRLPSPAHRDSPRRGPPSLFAQSTLYIWPGASTFDSDELEGTTCHQEIFANTLDSIEDNMIRASMDEFMKTLSKYSSRWSMRLHHTSPMLLSSENGQDEDAFTFKEYQLKVMDFAQSNYPETFKSASIEVKLAEPSQGSEMVAAAARYHRDKLRAEGAKGRITIAKEIISQVPYNMQCW